MYQISKLSTVHGQILRHLKNVWQPYRQPHRHRSPPILWASFHEAKNVISKNWILSQKDCKMSCWCFCLLNNTGHFIFVTQITNTVSLLLAHSSIGCVSNLKLFSTAKFCFNFYDTENKKIYSMQSDGLHPLQPLLTSLTNSIECYGGCTHINKYRDDTNWFRNDTNKYGDDTKNDLMQMDATQ